MKAMVDEAKEVINSMKFIIQENKQLKAEIVKMDKNARFGKAITDGMFKAMEKLNYKDGNFHNVKLNLEFQGRIGEAGALDIGDMKLTPASGNIVLASPDQVPARLT